MTLSVRKYVNVPDFSAIQQIVTNFMSVTGTNGSKNTRYMCSLALLSWVLIQGSRRVVGLLMDHSANPIRSKTSAIQCMNVDS